MNPQMLYLVENLCLRNIETQICYTTCELGRQMKKINSIDYGGKIIGTGLLIGLLIPGILLLFNRHADSMGITVLAIILAAVGVLIILFFTIHLCVELKQDKKINQYYREHKNVKIRLSDGTCECGACGSRAIRIESVSCNACGCKFENSGNKTPQDILDK